MQWRIRGDGGQAAGRDLEDGERHMRRQRQRASRWAAVLLVILSVTMLPGCHDTILDAVLAGGLDFLQGAVTGLAGFLVFGENPPALIFNGILNAIGSGAGGGGAHH